MNVIALSVRERLVKGAEAKRCGGREMKSCFIGDTN